MTIRVAFIAIILLLLSQVEVAISKNLMPRFTSYVKELPSVNLANRASYLSSQPGRILLPPPKVTRGRDLELEDEVTLTEWTSLTNNS